MPLLKAGAVVPDPFLPVTAETLEAASPSLPPVPLLVPLVLAPAHRDRLAAHRQQGHGLGLAVDPATDIRTLADWLPDLDLVALHFPRFGDGRAYSQARVLRQRLGFAGEIRATGQVLRDQMLFMLRCGFDALALPDSVSPLEAAAQWQAAEAEFTRFYQPAARAGDPVIAAGRGVAAAAE